MTRPALFVAVTGLLAALLAVAGALIARVQDESINVWLSMGTALVIATFLAFLILGPRVAKADEPAAAPAAEGFAVVKQEETTPQIVPREAEVDVAPATPSGEPKQDVRSKRPGDEPRSDQP